MAIFLSQYFINYFKNLVFIYLLKFTINKLFQHKQFIWLMLKSQEFASWLVIHFFTVHNSAVEINSVLWKWINNFDLVRKSLHSYRGKQLPLALALMMQTYCGLWLKVQCEETCRVKSKLGLIQTFKSSVYTASDETLFSVRQFILSKHFFILCVCFSANPFFKCV